MRRLNRPVVLGAIVALFASAAVASAGIASAAVTTAASTRFTDVPPSQLFYGDITWLASHNITTGNGDGTFGPAQSVTREQMAAFLYRFANAGKTAPACTSSPFPDVSVASPFCGDIAWLKSHGITTGNANGTYGLLTPVGRGEMAAFMYRIVNAGHTPAECEVSPFPDVSVTSPFCGHITWLVGQGVTGGFTDGGYHPAAPVARGAMAAFLHRLSAPAPATSAAHYVRTTDQNLLSAAGVADATADQHAGGSHLHLLDIGAQSRTAPLSTATPGVVLSATSDRITYPVLVTLIESYLAGYESVAGLTATIAVGTNSDGCFTTCTPATSNYPATTKGSDWWSQVVAPLRTYAATSAPSVTVVGANDFEPGFSATQTQAQQWEQTYVAAATAAGTTGLQLVFNGSADGCPILYGQTGGSCNAGWTEAGLASLAGGPHVAALPQIYNADQATQWANIASTVHGNVSFLGPLTEHSINAETSQLPSLGWISLWNALTAAAIAPTLPYSAGLDVIS